jgi:phage replication-related protein YjqB (UPF0714/DUF867 family)
MPDKYLDFDHLSRNETSGIDYAISVRRLSDAFAIVAPHGGGIEPGTSEIADAIAGGEFCFYAFDGLKTSSNTDLHITSTSFDEPMCLTLIRQSDVVVTIHGESSDAEGKPVFMGGRNAELGECLRAALAANGFDVRRHPDPLLQGLEPKNLCNRGGKSRSGVQLELSRSLREAMFQSLSREGRKHTTSEFAAFVAAVRGALNGACNAAPPQARESAEVYKSIKAGS